MHSIGSVEFHYDSLEPLNSYIFCIHHMYALMIFEIWEYHVTCFLNQRFFANIKIESVIIFEKIDQLTTSKTQYWISVEFVRSWNSGWLFVKSWGDWSSDLRKKFIWELLYLFEKKCRIILEVICFCLIGIKSFSVVNTADCTLW